MIVVNGRFLSQRITGIQRFAYEICCALHQIGVDIRILAPANIEKDYNLDGLTIEVIGGKGSHYWEQVTLPAYMKRHYNGEYLLSLSGLSPLWYNRNIMTIHDISYLLRPRSYSLPYCLYYQFMTPLIAGRAQQILTVSEFSKTELVQRLGLPAEKIEVVYNAVRPSPLLPRGNNKEKYLLAVGSHVPRKNVRRVLEAYCRIENPDFELYVVGGKNAVYADAGLRPYTTRKGIRFLGYVTGQELTRLYRNATAYINASLYEGFGIPIVEAMGQECAVVVSDIPAFREVSGDAALYFDPMNVADICDKMETIMQSEKTREQLVTKGNERVKLFSWKSSAMKVQEIFKKLKE